MSDCNCGSGGGDCRCHGDSPENCPPCPEISKAKLTLGSLWQLIIAAAAVIGFAFGADARIESKIEKADHVRRVDMTSIHVALERLHTEIRALRRDISGHADPR